MFQERASPDFRVCLDVRARVCQLNLVVKKWIIFRLALGEIDKLIFILYVVGHFYIPSMHLLVFSCYICQSKKQHVCICLYKTFA